jgi:DNA polymerase sigma
MTSNIYCEISNSKNRIQQILDYQYKYEVNVIYFGSISNNLGTYNSDCDLLLKFPSNFTQGNINEELEEIVKILKNYEYKFLSMWKTKAGDKVVKFLDYKENFYIDIAGYDEILCYKTNLITAYCNVNTDIRDAVMIIKIWADRRELNNPGTTRIINSYCHVLMFITYLIIIGVVPNLRTMSPKFNCWEARKIEYYPVIYPLQNPETDRICNRYCKLAKNNDINIPIYFHESLEVNLGDDWDIEEAIKGYFYFMGFCFDYLNWDISIYHGNIVQSSTKIVHIDRYTKLLRVHHPFRPDLIESRSALPWCVDGLKWEFMRGYHLLTNNDWNELMHEVCHPDAQDVYECNMYTYTSLY